MSSAVTRASVKHSLRRHAEAMARADLLDAVWEGNIDPDGTALAIEFLAMAHRRKLIQEEIARYAAPIRAIQTVALNPPENRGEAALPIPSIVGTVVRAAVARALAMEANVGIDLGHAETRKAVEALLADLSAPPA